MDTRSRGTDQNLSKSWFYENFNVNYLFQSEFGTFVNGSKIIPNVKTQLWDGDVVGLGTANANDESYIFKVKVFNKPLLFFTCVN